MHGFGGIGMGWYWIIGILILVLFVWLIIRPYNQNSAGNQKKSALDILKDRYARGEINTKEFEENRSHLNS